MPDGCLRPLCYNTSHRRAFTPRLQHICALLDAVEGSLEGDNLSILWAVRQQTRRQSLPVYLVGGPVRDALLGAPIRDLDFVVEGDAPEVARRLARDLGGQVLTHDRFGTATLALGDARCDLVTARREVYPRAAALPEVSPGTVYDDLARRDFSVNALALPLGESHPKVLDLHGGLDDLSSGLVRVLHPNSFVDDPTRVLRAVRYEQRLGFRIEDGTLARLRQSIAAGHLAALTGDRLRHELEWILREDRPWLALRRALELGILTAIHPSLGDEEAAGRLEALASSVAQGAPGAPLRADWAGPLVYLGALAYPLSSTEGEALIHRLNMPNSWAQVVRDTALLREREVELAAPTLARSRLFRLAEGLAPEAVLAVSTVTGSPSVARRLAEYQSELRFEAPTLGGRDLLAMGVPDGPMVGRVLDELREAKLDRRVSTGEEERRLVLEILARKSWPGNPGTLSR